MKMENYTAKIKPLNTNSQPERSKNGNKAILIALINKFFNIFPHRANLINK